MLGANVPADIIIGIKEDPKSAAATNSLVGQLNKLRGAANKAALSFAKLASASKSISVKAVATTQATQQAATALNNVGNAGHKAAGSFTQLAGAFTGVMVAGKAKQLLQDTLLTPMMKYEAALTRMRVLSGMSIILSLMHSLHFIGVFK
jgi:hypothetical protein